MQREADADLHQLVAVFVEISQDEPSECHSSSSVNWSHVGLQYINVSAFTQRENTK